MKDWLHIGSTVDGKAFRLPVDMATGTLAIIARKGAGKTQEELFAQ